MFNTMTITKAAGALIGSLLFLLLVMWVGSGLFSIAPAMHGEGEHAAQAYTVDTGEGDAAATEEVVEETVDFGALLAAADPAKGEKVFGKCKACHTVEGVDRTGPHLNGVVGRTPGTVEGFSYSDGMKAHGAETVWTPEALHTFLLDPKGVVPGNKMSFKGLKKDTDIANLVAFLQSRQ